MAQGGFEGGPGRGSAGMVVMACGGVGVEAEEVVEALLGGVDLGEHAPGAGPAPFALVEQHGLLDAGEGAEQFPYAHVEPVAVGFADHEPGDGQGEHAVEDVDPDLLVGPVEHGREGHDLGVFHLAEVALGRFLGAVVGDD